MLTSGKKGPSGSILLDNQQADITRHIKQKPRNHQISRCIRSCQFCQTSKYNSKHHGREQRLNHCPQRSQDCLLVLRGKVPLHEEKDQIPVLKGLPQVEIKRPVLRRDPRLEFLFHHVRLRRRSRCCPPVSQKMSSVYHNRFSYSIALRGKGASRHNGEECSCMFRKCIL